MSSVSRRYLRFFQTRRQRGSKCANCCAAIRLSAGVSTGNRNDGRRERNTPVREHDAVALAGLADCQSPAAVAGAGATRACAVTRWRSRSRPLSACCGSSIRISNTTLQISAKRRFPAAGPAAGGVDEFQGVGFQHDEPYGSQTLAAPSVLCGDFNFDVTDRQHALIDRSARPGLNYRDAWTICHPGHRDRQPADCTIVRNGRMARTVAILFSRQKI